jgi:hypothetical protein
MVDRNRMTRYQSPVCWPVVHLCEFKKVTEIKRQIYRNWTVLDLNPIKSNNWATMGNNKLDYNLVLTLLDVFFVNFHCRLANSGAWNVSFTYELAILSFDLFLLKRKGEIGAKQKV